MTISDKTSRLEAVPMIRPEFPAMSASAVGDAEHVGVVSRVVAAPARRRQECRQTARHGADSVVGRIAFTWPHPG
jgi:hypothetical protein